MIKELKEKLLRIAGLLEAGLDKEAQKGVAQNLRDTCEVENSVNKFHKDLLFDLDAIGFGQDDEPVSGSACVDVMCMYIEQLRNLATD